ncbi:MAG TPA: hypothetical protein VFL81_02005 [Candidatus Saccharimonadales bacterium]|nr:hypothetical protein [Candidatus Saccharimonadales bacterium]
MKHKPRHHLNFVKPATCGGKNRYPTRAQAEAVKTEQETIDPELELKIYRCIGCGDWHLTRAVRSQF